MSPEHGEALRVSPEQEVESKLLSLRSGHLTVDQVKYWAIENNLIGKLSPINKTEWPICFVLIWIALRNEISVEVEWLHVVEAGEPRLNYDDLNGIPIYHQAKETLWAALATGRIEAYANFDNGSAGNYIPALMWDRNLNFGRSDRLVDLERVSPNDRRTFVHVTVPKSHAIQLWPKSTNHDSERPEKKTSFHAGAAIALNPSINFRKKPGPKNTKSEKAMVLMRADLAKGDDLKAMPPKQLEKYGISRNTAVKAREIVLSELASVNSDNCDN